MCRAVLESGEDQAAVEGINDGIMFLMAVPYILVAVIGYYVYWKYSKSQKSKNTEETRSLTKKLCPCGSWRSKMSKEEREEWLRMEEDESKNSTNDSSVIIMDIVVEEKTPTKEGQKFPSAPKLT